MKWTDTQRIAEELFDRHPEIDPKTVRFTQLRQLILDLPEFDDDPQRSGERNHEAVQLAWIDEAEYAASHYISIPLKRIFSGSLTIDAGYLKNSFRKQTP